MGRGKDWNPSPISSRPQTLRQKIRHIWKYFLSKSQKHIWNIIFLFLLYSSDYRKKINPPLDTFGFYPSPRAYFMCSSWRKEVFIPSPWKKTAPTCARNYHLNLSLSTDASSLVHEYDPPTEQWILRPDLVLKEARGYFATALVRAEAFNCYDS